MAIDKEVRVRFAPSPTGPLHIGGVRTALYNYLFAKQHNGKFLLRIEDTDQVRYVPGAQEYIIEALNWCGINPDEGVGVGGDFGPYIQSERKDIYQVFVKQLINTNKAYYAFDTPEELEEIRETLQKDGNETFFYGSKNRMRMKNSLSMPPDVVQQWISEGKPFVVRFLMPENTELIINDLIRGEVKVNTSTLDDKVLSKSDGMPTYHLANIVDDHLMKITHVIRGEEWLPSMPLHIMLYRAFGWEAPQFAHLPLLLKPDGNGKLSKRDGDRLGFPVFPLQWTNPETGELSSGYKESGYFPEAFINMLALLGWNPGTEQEIFSLPELVNSFSIERVSKAGAKFSPDKAKWFNHQYIINKSDEELLTLAMPYINAFDKKYDTCTLKKICGLVKERLTFVKDITSQIDFFFVAPILYDEKVVQKRWKDTTPDDLKTVINILDNISNFNTEECEKNIKDWVTVNEINTGYIFNVLRLCLVGEAKGPHLFNIMEVLGKEECISRLERAANTIAL